MNLIFNSNVDATSTITVKDSDGSEIISFYSNSADFISRTVRRTYLQVLKLIMSIIFICMELI